MAITLHNPDEEEPPRPIPPRPAEGMSKRIVDEANRLDTVTDAKGRVIGWRKLDVLEEMDLAEIAGAQNVANPQWMLFAMVAMGVRELDGQPLSRPVSKQQIRARVKHLGADGINAVLTRMQELVGDGQARKRRVRPRRG